MNFNYSENSMKVIPKYGVTIKELIEGYIPEEKLEENAPVLAYDGKLCVRPEYQRSFIYDDEQAMAVIGSILRNRPLNNIYFVKRVLSTNQIVYDLMDGQQRILSICQFAKGLMSVIFSDLNDGRPINIGNLQHRYPELYERFMNYELEVKECVDGTKDEVLDWFRTINTAGERLTEQELRNADYTGPWLLDAKKYFSKYRNTATKTPAEQIGENFFNKKLRPERQEILELALQWKVNSKKNTDILNYMEAHYKDKNALELWRYFQNVIDWAHECFPEMAKEDSQKINWGALYAAYNDQELDPDLLMTRWAEVKLGYTNKELLNITYQKMAKYCITGNKQDLSVRCFTDKDRATLYRLQNKKCAKCGKEFDLKDLVAHHKKPWDRGGLTEISNGELLCPDCHHKAHNM